MAGSLRNVLRAPASVIGSYSPEINARHIYVRGKLIFAIQRIFTVLEFDEVISARYLRVFVRHCFACHLLPGRSLESVLRRPLIPEQLIPVLDSFK